MRVFGVDGDVAVVRPADTAIYAAGGRLNVDPRRIIDVDSVSNFGTAG